MRYGYNANAMPMQYEHNANAMPSSVRFGAPGAHFATTLGTTPLENSRRSKAIPNEHPELIPRASQVMGLSKAAGSSRVGMQRAARGFSWQPVQSANERRLSGGDPGGGAQHREVRETSVQEAKGGG